MGCFIDYPSGVQKLHKCREHHCWTCGACINLKPHLKWHNPMHVDHVTNSVKNKGSYTTTLLCFVGEKERVMNV
jgi:hypothetical protein